MGITQVKVKDASKKKINAVFQTLLQNVSLCNTDPIIGWHTNRTATFKDMANLDNGGLRTTDKSTFSNIPTFLIESQV